MWLVTGSYWALVAMSVATIGIYGCGHLLAVALYVPDGAAAAAGIALINSIGKPRWLRRTFMSAGSRDSTKSSRWGLYFMQPARSLRR